jgi:hypothetical protein
MTDSGGARVVRDRLGAALGSVSTNVAGQDIEAEVNVSVKPFDGSVTPDVRSFVKELRNLHLRETKVES